jgi:fructose-bisphosphate aldolase class I
MISQMTDKAGFIAALDQSGGSTPGALRAYGIQDNAYDGEEAMFRLMHDMRVRIMTAPAFSGHRVMLNVTIPTTPDFYKPFGDHKAMVRFVALSGGYGRGEACAKLRNNHGMIASFSRALTEDLRIEIDDTAFNANLGSAIDEIFAASTRKA